MSKLIELEVPPGAGQRSYGFMSEKRPQKQIRAPVEEVKKCLEMAYSRGNSRQFCSQAAQTMQLPSFGIVQSPARSLEEHGGG